LGGWNWNGEAMSSSPWGEALGKGDEDVATLAHAGLRLWFGCGEGVPAGWRHG
jgi:hypothetical protein